MDCKVVLLQQPWRGMMVLGAGGPPQGSSVSLQGQTPASPMLSWGEEDQGVQTPPSLQGVGRDGQAPRKGKHVENVFCLWFHLGASNLLAQLIGTVNLQLHLTACTGLKMGVKAFPALWHMMPTVFGPQLLAKGWNLLGRLGFLCPTSSRALN